MLMATSLLIPLALTTSADLKTPQSYDAVRAFVTGYNTVTAQTDDTPCIAASGANICGRHDAVACPRVIDLGTVVEIRGTTYVCEDRTARKYNSRFDISCDKDTSCPYEVAGWAIVKIYPRAATSAPRPPVRLAERIRFYPGNAMSGRRFTTALAHRGPGLRGRMHTAVAVPHVAHIVFHQRYSRDRNRRQVRT
jgi:hypothetical protein